MLDLVARIREEQRATLIFVTHAPEDARRIAGQVVLVEGGGRIRRCRPSGCSPTPPPALRDYLG